jgi:hypothetical protein
MGINIVEQDLSTSKVVTVLQIRIRDPVPFWPLDPDPG